MQGPSAPRATARGPSVVSTVAEPAERGRFPRSRSLAQGLHDGGAADVVLVELMKSCECGICLEVMFMPCVGLCGHSFCHGCIGRLGRTSVSAVCPICRAPFGALHDRPANLLVSSLIQQYFPLEYERKRAQQPLPAAGPLVLRARGGGNDNMAVADRGRQAEVRAHYWLRPAWRRFILWLRPLWPWVRFAAPLVYPALVVVLWLFMFRSVCVRQRMPPRRSLMPL